MELLKMSIDWAKAEVFSSTFFILFGLLFIGVSFGFWQLGKTDLARAYITPTLIAGALLIIVGGGLVYSNISRINHFPNDHKDNPSAFLETEIERTESTLQEYKTVFIAIPLIIAVCALLMIFFASPIWRASLITTILMLGVVLLIDGNAGTRIGEYHNQLVLVEKQNLKY